MSPIRTINRLYSHENHAHELRAAIMDGLDAIVASVTLMVAGALIINHFRAQNPWGTVGLLGYSHISFDVTDWHNLLPIAFAGMLSFALSLVAIVMASYKSRPQPKHRPIGRTALAMITAVGLAVGIEMLLDQSTGLDSIITGIEIFLPAFMPAALRLTAKDAFAYERPVTTAITA